MAINLFFIGRPIWIFNFPCYIKQISNFNLCICIHHYLFSQSLSLAMWYIALCLWFYLHCSSIMFAYVWFCVCVCVCVPSAAVSAWLGSVSRSLRRCRGRAQVGHLTLLRKVRAARQAAQREASGRGPRSLRSTLARPEFSQDAPEAGAKLRETQGSFYSANTKGS